MRKKIYLLLAVIAAIAIICIIRQCQSPAPEEANPSLSVAAAETASKDVQPQASADDDTAAPTESSATEQPKKVEFSDAIDMSKWLYNTEDKVYYQLGILYCQNPADEKYEKLALFVPEAFMECQKNAATTYTCQPKNDKRIGSFSSQSAPFVIPIESPQYASNPALTEYKSFKKFTDAGYIYVHIGFRGREHGAPLGLVDLKAAIRYLRHNQNHIAGYTGYMFPFGSGEGGGLSVLLGTSANSPLFKPYLKAIGAIEGGSDRIYGVMAWNPITNLDSANEAYEWNMGMTRRKLSEDQKKLSDKMAREFADYINKSGFLDNRKKPLILQYSSRGIYQEGTYYDYVKSAIEYALSDYIERTKFPHRVSEKATKDFKGELNMAGYYMDKEKYLKALNEKHNWVQYDFMHRSVTIRSVEDFMRSFKPATKEIGAFDSFNRSAPENMLFGIGDGKGKHFDTTMLKLLKNTPQAKEYADDLTKQDAYGYSVKQRLEMYTPLYYIMSSYDGYRTASIAPFWRIRSGINQTETPLTTDINLALALQQYQTVSEVDFRPVWNVGNVNVQEYDQDSEEAFIKWVDNVVHRYYKWNDKD